MKNELLTAHVIANALASEIASRIAKLSDQPSVRDEMMPKYRSALVTSPNLDFLDQHLSGTIEDLMKVVGPQLDVTCELLAKVSGNAQPVFLREPELPGGLEHSEAAISGDVRLRYLRAYDISTNRKYARLDFLVVGINWGYERSITGRPDNFGIHFDPCPPETQIPV